MVTRSFSLIILLALTVFFGGCRDSERVVREPVQLRFPIANKGSKLDLVLQVDRAAIYTVYLSIPLPKENAAAMNRLRRFAGSATYVGEQRIEASTPSNSPIRLTIWLAGQGNAPPIFNHTIITGELMAASEDDVSLAFARIRLLPGRYMVSIESIEDIPELQNLATSIGIFVRH